MILIYKDLILRKQPLAGWRKAKDWRRCLKRQMRSVGQISAKGGRNKEERLQQATEKYLTKACAFARKVKAMIENPAAGERDTVAAWLELWYYHERLVKHIERVDRRILQGEVIPHQEKLFSIFQPYAEWINKGKQHPPVEIGKGLTITTDQYHLLLDWQVGQHQTDRELPLPIADRLTGKYTVQSMSFDRGFYEGSNKALLETEIPQVIMPKKGKREEEERQLEEALAFKRLKNKHNAVESNINELEHRGLDRCPDRTWRNFKRYIGLAVTAYHLHKIGRELPQRTQADDYFFNTL